jgi:hypothetical protein
MVKPARWFVSLLLVFSFFTLVARKLEARGVSFVARRDFAVGSPLSVASGDFNSDGVLDLAVANSSSSSLSVFLGNGDGTFQAATNFGVGGVPRSVAVGDFNGDGKLDLVTANESNDVSVLINNSSP